MLIRPLFNLESKRSDIKSDSIEIRKANERLQQDITNLKQRQGSKKSNASILSIIQEIPCSTRCQYEINNTTWPEIDSLYGAKHDSVKKN